MKIILDDKYLVSMSALAEITLVEPFGDWNSRRYKVLGEPEGITVVPDEKVVQGDAAKQAEDECAAKALVRVEQELAKLKLANARSEAVTRIMAEKGRVKRADVEAFLQTQSTLYCFPSFTSHDVRKWLAAQAQKEAEA